MSVQLHLGCGPHRLPPPWQNFDRDCDMTQRLPFADGSARFIKCEHAIEHLTFADGFRFLIECVRVLEPGGVLRLAFPDVARVLPKDFREYDKMLQTKGVRVDRPFAAWRSMLTGWGHQSCWSRDMSWPVLKSAGFWHVSYPRYGKSDKPELCGVDGHHLECGMRIAAMETTICDAIKGYDE